MKVLSTLFVLLLTSFAHAAGTPLTPLTSAQEALLLEIKTKTIAYVDRQKQEAEKIRHCFALPSLCDGDLQKRLPRIRSAVRQKSDEYRLLLALAHYEDLKLSHSVRLSLSLPRLSFGAPGYKETPEYSLIQKLMAQDLKAMQEKVQKNSAGPSKYPAVNLDGYALMNEQKKAKEFYQMQALVAIHQIPFIVYIENEKPADAEIAKALGKYLKQVNLALNDLYDETANPLESFLVYQPIVKQVADSSLKKRAMIEQLILRQKHGVGIAAWIERNKPSVKLAAFSTCSLVAATLQAWPVSLACGGALTLLTGKQLFEDYFRMKENFALWLVGAQSAEALKSAEARVLYSMLALFFAGQGVGSALMSIESGLIATLSALPSVAAARFTSLNALREGGLRFATRTVEFKGKDLGASLVAGAYEEITDPTLNLSREERLFTYKDLLQLQALQ